MDLLLEHRDRLLRVRTDLHLHAILGHRTLRLLETGHENRIRRRLRLSGLLSDRHKDRLQRGHSEDERRDHLEQELQYVRGHRDCSVVPARHDECPREQV